jgi:hypothetical protein
MIAASDRVTLPIGVALVADGVHDSVRDGVLAVNEVGRYVLGRAGERVADIAAGLALAYGIDRQRALDDVSAFCGELNSRLLLNVHARPVGLVVAGRWLARAVRMLPLGIVPPLPLRRRPIDTRGAVPAIVSTGAALWRFTAGLVLFLGLLGVALLDALGVHDPALPVALAAAVGIGLVAHEAAHAALLGGVPACVATGGTRVFVMHRRLPARRRRVVAAAGPLGGGLAAWLLIGLAAASGLAEAAVAALALSAQPLGLTVAGRDGRAACGLS